MKWAVAWAILILTGIMFFLNVDMEKEVYWLPYYVWDKLKDVFACTAFLCLFKKHKYLYLPLLFFLIIRLLWELADIIKIEYNKIMVGNTLFLLLILILLIIYSKEKKWRK